MTRAGERVKGATSARPFGGRQRSGAALWPASGRAGADPRGLQRPVRQRKGNQARGGGVVESLRAAWPENRRSSHWQIFSLSRRISERQALLTATPSMKGQAGAPQSNGMRRGRGYFFPPAELRRQGGRKGVGTEGTMRTPHQSAQLPADLAAGSCSHSPARQVGTAGTDKRVGARQEIRALVASPARALPGWEGCYVS